MQPRFSIVLPCYNEAENIPLMLDKFRSFAERKDFELILVNNGSTDHSQRVMTLALEDPQNDFLRVVTIEKNVGYGHGIHNGLAQARGEILAYSHADIQTPPEDIFKAFDLIVSQNIDLNQNLVKGFRVHRSDNQTFLTKSLSWVVKMVLGVDVKDINGQPKVFLKSFWSGLTHAPTDFSYDVYLLYRAAVQGMQITTFDVSFGERIHGQSKWASSIFSKYKTILKYFVSIFRLGWKFRSEKQNALGQFLRFCSVGILTNLVNYGTFWTLLSFSPVHYVLCSVVGFLAGGVVGFLANRTFTFQARDAGAVQGQFVKFFVVNIGSLLVNTATIYGLVGYGGLMPEIGQLFAIAASTVINFLGSKYWAFSKKAVQE